MDMGKPQNHKHRPMNSREAEHHHVGARQGPAVAASCSITPWCCPPSHQASPCNNLSAGPNLSKGLIWKTGLLSLKPWTCMGTAAHPKHKTRQGLVIQVIAGNFTARSERRKSSYIPCCRECGFAGGQKGGPSVQVAVKGRGECSAACRNWPCIGYTPSYLR